MGAKRSRDERKDAAAAKHAAQQARDRRQKRIVFGITIPIVVLIIAAVPATNWYNAHQRGKTHAVGYVKTASPAAKAAGCTGVRNDRQIPTSVVKNGTTVDYAALTKAAGQDVPPTSGPRYADPLPDTPQFYAFKSAPRPERAVGNLNHGYVVVWYDSKLPASDVKTLQTAVASNTRTLVVPWTRSVFPDGQHVVYTAWDRTQRCTKASAAVMTEFANAYRDADPSGQGWASPSAPTPNVASSASPTAAPVTVVPSATVSAPIASATGTATTTPVPATPTPAAPATSAPAAVTTTPAAVASSPVSRITVSPVR